MASKSTHLVRLGDERFAVDVGENGELRIAGLEGTWRVSRDPDGSYLVVQADQRWRVDAVTESGDAVQAFVDGEFYALDVEREGRARRTAGRPHVEPLTVPMPARVVKVLVSDGQAVKRGDVLITLEAMKMEMPLRAPRDGSVRAIACREGDLVQPGASLLEIA